MSKRCAALIGIVGMLTIGALMASSASAQEEDGFLGAYWRRPRGYLRPSVRRAISTFARVGGVEAGIQRLRADLQHAEHAH